MPSQSSSFLFAHKLLFLFVPHRHRWTYSFLSDVSAELYFDRGNFYDFTSLGEVHFAIVFWMSGLHVSSPNLSFLYAALSENVTSSLRIMNLRSSWWKSCYFWLRRCYTFQWVVPDGSERVYWKCAVRELDVPGEIIDRKTFPFEFSTVEMPYESYIGVNVRLRYSDKLSCIYFLLSEIYWLCSVF